MVIADDYIFSDFSGYCLVFPPATLFCGYVDTLSMPYSPRIYKISVGLHSQSPNNHVTVATATGMS